MTCPSCNEEVDDGAAICPHCDAVLDEAAFGEPEAQPAPPKAPPKRSADPRQAAKPAARPAVPAAAAPFPAPSVPVGRRKRKKVEIDYSPDRILGDTWQVIQALLPFDQVALYGCAGMGLALFFPWRSTQAGGEEIGAFSGGWPVVLLLLAAGAALFIRTSDDLRGLRPDTLASVQFFAALLSIGYCTWYFFNAIDNHPYRSLLGTTNLKMSSPQAGVVICAICAIVLGTGSLWAWMVERG
ncbi:MAG: hypothetical protein ACYDCL_01570 [Myxococcales bacterium]